MNRMYKSIAVIGFGIAALISAPAFAQSPVAAAEAPPAPPESIVMYGKLVLRGELSVDELRDHAASNCDHLSMDDVAAVREWLRRMGAKRDAPQ